MDGYIRMVNLMFGYFQSERYTLRHVPTTVRKSTDNAFTKVPRMWTDLKRMSASTHGAHGAHFLAQYRGALPRELVLTALCKRRQIPYAYHIYAGAHGFVRAAVCADAGRHGPDASQAGWCSARARRTGWVKDNVGLDGIWIYLSRPTRCPRRPGAVLGRCVAYDLRGLLLRAERCLFAP